jgi:Oxidoreductase family, C-terminal alpha/beta domain
VSKNHMGNFFDCVRSRHDPICDVETGHRSATMCHLGAIALRTGLKLTWDSDTEIFVGDNALEGNRYLSRTMRAPYDYSFGA